MPGTRNVRGLVLREVSFRDADKLVDLLTEEGILTVTARGARKANAKYGVQTQAFVYGDFSLRESKGRYYLEHAVSRDLFYGLRSDLEGLALAAYFSDLVRQTATDQPQPQLLRLFVYALHYLSEGSRDRTMVKAIFELRLMTELGMMPKLVCCTRCMTYVPAHPVLRITDADLICAECLPEPAEHDMPVTPSVLQAARHVVFADYDRLFGATLKNPSLAQFSVYAEQYVRCRLDGLYFPTLQYYHRLTNHTETSYL